VYLSGDPNVGVARACPRGAAHCPQNLFSGGFAALQAGHRAESEAAHCPQYFIPAGFSWLHWEHCTVTLTAFPGPTGPGKYERMGRASSNLCTVTDAHAPVNVRLTPWAAFDDQGDR
jgi:hypothetical protein